MSSWLQLTIVEREAFAEVAHEIAQERARAIKRR